MIPVTEPFMPPFEEYVKYLKGVWNRKWLTNNGPLVNELELKLKEYLEVSHLLYLTNGTMALQVAIKVLDLDGEIITTPFSYVATTSSIVWEGCQPVFVDIRPDTLNIDTTKIEERITEKTSAILVTHVYGNPCDIEEISRIAKKHKLKVIYDAAHCFGTTYKGKSVLNYGDISTVSFHATKLFHTVEGGAVITKDPELLKSMAFKANFGHNGPTEYSGVGINAKNSEFHAAMGLVNLNHINEILNARKEMVLYYRERLAEANVSWQSINKKAGFNYAYCPIIFESEEMLEVVMGNLNAHKVFPRRYFCPSLNTIGLSNYVEMPVSESISKRVMCLPLYHTLSNEEIDLICRVVLRAMRYS